MLWPKEVCVSIASSATTRYALPVELKETRRNLNETDEEFPAIQAIIDEYWRK
jgi:hypothetical protein